MISRYSYKKLRWIDVESPTKAEIEALREEFDLPPLVTEELLTEPLRSKVDLYSNAMYLVLHFPTSIDNRRRTREQEVDFVIGHDFLITVHYEPINALHTFSKQFEVSSILDRSQFGDHAGYLFYYIIKELYNDTTRQLEDLNAVFRNVEQNIFDGHEGKMVHTISQVNRTLLDFQQALRPHGESLRSFESAGRSFFGERFAYHLSVIVSEYHKIDHILDGHKNILNDLRQTNESLLTSKTNDRIKTLTILNSIIAPISLIAFIFGMNSHLLFLTNWTQLYFVFGSMAIVGLVMIIYFKARRWF